MSRERPKRGTLPPAQENTEKLQKVVEEGNYYGAQQMYKSISARYVAAERYSEALDILQSAACIQSKHQQVILPWFWYLSLGNLRDANILMDKIKKKVEAKKLELPQSDLIKFIKFLLQTSNYKSSLDREPTFHELLDEIAEMFYGVRRRNPLQGMEMFGESFKIHQCIHCAHRKGVCMNFGGL